MVRLMPVSYEGRRAVIRSRSVRAIACGSDPGGRRRLTLPLDALSADQETDMGVKGCAAG